MDGVAFRLGVAGEVLLLVGALAGTIWWQRRVQGLLGGGAGVLEPQWWSACWQC